MQEKPNPEKLLVVRGRACRGAEPRGGGAIGRKLQAQSPPEARKPGDRMGLL